VSRFLTKQHSVFYDRSLTFSLLILFLHLSYLFPVKNTVCQNLSFTTSLHSMVSVCWDCNTVWPVFGDSGVVDVTSSVTWIGIFSFTTLLPVLILRTILQQRINDFRKQNNTNIIKPNNSDKTRNALSIRTVTLRYWFCPLVVVVGTSVDSRFSEVVKYENSEILIIIIIIINNDNIHNNGVLYIS